MGGAALQPLGWRIVGLWEAVYTQMRDRPLGRPDRYAICGSSYRSGPDGPMSVTL